MSHKFLAETIKTEQPELWNKLGNPKYSYFGNKPTKEYIEYLRTKAYKKNPNPKIVWTVTCLRLSQSLFFCSFMALAFYFGFSFIEKIAK